MTIPKFAYIRSNSIQYTVCKNFVTYHENPPLPFISLFPFLLSFYYMVSYEKLIELILL